MCAGTVHFYSKEETSSFTLSISVSVPHALLRTRQAKGTESSLDQIPILAARSNVNPWALLLWLCPFICSLNPTPVHRNS